MKENWTYKKLGEVCDEAQTYKWGDKEKKYIDLTSVDRETHCITETIVVNKENAPSRAKQLVKIGDVLFGTTRPTMKRVCVIDDLFDEQVCSTGFCLLRPTQSVLPRWIYYNLLSDSFYSYIEPLQNGVAYPAVSNKDVRNYQIPIPPIEAQSRIVSELDLLQSIIDKQQVQLKELDNLAQAVFYDMFGDPMENEKGWSVKKLNEICLELFAGGDVPKDCYSQEKTTDFQTPIISNGIGERAIYGYTNKARVFDESITISGRGTIGYCEVRTEPYFPVVRLIVGVPNKKMVLPTFLKYVIDAHHLNGVGVAIPQLTIPMVKDINIILPPLPIQQSFNDKIKSIEKLKTAISKSIMETQKLYDYTTDKYFG